MPDKLSCIVLKVQDLGYFYLFQNPFVPTRYADWRLKGPRCDGPFESRYEALDAVTNRFGRPGKILDEVIEVESLQADKYLLMIIERSMGRPVCDTGATKELVDISRIIFKGSKWGREEEMFSLSDRSEGGLNVVITKGWEDHAAVLGSGVLTIRRNVLGITLSLEGSMSVQHRQSLIAFAQRLIAQRFPKEELHIPREAYEGPALVQKKLQRFASTI